MTATSGPVPRVVRPILLFVTIAAPLVAIFSLLQILGVISVDQPLIEASGALFFAVALTIGALWLWPRQHRWRAATCWMIVALGVMRIGTSVAFVVVDGLTLGSGFWLLVGCAFVAIGLVAVRRGSAQSE